MPLASPAPFSAPSLPPGGDSCAYLRVWSPPRLPPVERSPGWDARGSRQLRTRFQPCPSCQPAGQAEATGEATLPTNQVGKRTHSAGQKGQTWRCPSTQWDCSPATMKSWLGVNSIYAGATEAPTWLGRLGGLGHGDVCHPMGYLPGVP